MSLPTALTLPHSPPSLPASGSAPTMRLTVALAAVFAGCGGAACIFSTRDRYRQLVGDLEPERLGILRDEASSPLWVKSWQAGGGDH